MSYPRNEKGAAFEAAILELTREFPPARVPKYYPNSSVRGTEFMVFEEDYQRVILHLASFSMVEGVLARVPYSGFPEDRVKAIVAMIYD